MITKPYPHLHIPSNKIPRSTEMNLISEDLARAHMQARMEEAERYRIGRSARASRWRRRYGADARLRRRMRFLRKH